MAAVDWVVGCHVKVATSLGEEFSGEVFGYDTSTKSVILKEGPGPEYTLRVLNTAFVKELERALEREAAAVKAARVAMMRIGVGVTAEGQEIFDSLSKTMPCVWEDKAIVILNEVVIESPYTPDHVSSRSGDQATLDRVKKVLEAQLAWRVLLWAFGNPVAASCALAAIVFLFVLLS